MSNRVNDRVGNLDNQGDFVLASKVEGSSYEDADVFPPDVDLKELEKQGYVIFFACEIIDIRDLIVIERNKNNERVFNMNLEMKIEAAIEEAKSENPSREMSIVITKLQEAKLWLEYGRKINK